MKEKIRGNVKVDERTGCWLWQKYVMKNGYGQACWPKGKVDYAHRASWTAFNGPIPDGLWVLHKCDNPKCVNPDHLFLGTHSDNMKDCVTKGRFKSNIMIGEHHPATSLREDDVLSIRGDGRSDRIIAEQYGVTRSAINKIKRRKNWKYAGGTGAMKLGTGANFLLQ